MDQHGLCVWNGEWGPVYVRKQYDGAATDAINEQRYRVLKDQLAIYNQASRFSCSFPRRSVANGVAVRRTA